VRTEYDLTAARDLFPEDAWQKPASSGGSGSEGCVEVNMAKWSDNLVGLRDSNHPEKGCFLYDQHEWQCFLKDAKGGQFDPPAA
jgi:Domain of unknown function (DUF397)